MSVKSKKGAAVVSLPPRVSPAALSPQPPTTQPAALVNPPPAAAALPTVPVPIPASSTPPSTSASLPALPSPVAEARCYCSDRRPLQSDLICSHNTASCYATHVSCLRDNSGVPFTDYLLGRSCFLCAHCVNRKGFKHPTEMECTLDSRHGCFYEKRGYTKQREAEAYTNTATVDEGMMVEKDKEGGREEMDVSEERDRTDSSDNAEQSTNGHNTASQPTRRSTRTAVDKDSTAVPVTGAATDPTSLTSQPAASLSLASSVLSSSTIDSLSVSPSPLIGASSDDQVEPKKAKRRGIRDADRKAKAKLVPRCTSPSHFLIDEPNAQQSTSAAQSAFHTSPASTHLTHSSSSSSAGSLSSTASHSRQIDKLRTDALLSSIASMYYSPRLIHSSAADVYVSADYDRFEYPTVDALLSPLRKASVLDDWSPMEVALFESGICSYGKDFHAISRLMAGRKTCGQCVEFFYVWKKSGHYAMWKEYGRPVRRRTDSKAEQWKVVEERMRGFSSRQDEDGMRRKRVVEEEEAHERQRMAENGSLDKKMKSDSGSSSKEEPPSNAKVEEDSSVSSHGVKAEGAFTAADSVALS